jgi:cell division protein FtsA
MKPEHFVGLDIGTSKVRCIVGMFDPNGENKPSIIGHGSALNRGMRRGLVVHVDEVAEAVNQAVTEAERISGIPIKRATVNVNGSHVEGFNSQGVIAISAADREITDEDRMRVEEAATIINLPQNREIVQFFAKNYSLDGQKNIKDPVGMHGIRLEVEAHMVTASTPNLRNLDMVLEKSDILPNHHSVSSLAAAEAVLTRDQKEAGTLLLDIGAGTTNMIVLEDGEVEHIAIIPIGGQHITNDLAIGLKTDLEVAERVKLEHASLIHGSSKAPISIKVNGRLDKFDHSDITMIIEARVEELLEYVQKELQKIKKDRKLPGGVVLTGGTSNLPGIVEFTRSKLELASRLARLQNIGGLVDVVEDQSFTTVVGLMLLDMLLLPALPVNTGGRFADSWSAKEIIGNVFKKIKNS